jgi:hypothetical protein
MWSPFLPEVLVILICMHLKLISSDTYELPFGSSAPFFCSFCLLINILPESLNYMDHIDFKIVIVLLVMLKMVGFMPKS